MKIQGCFCVDPLQAPAKKGETVCFFVLSFPSYRFRTQTHSRFAQVLTVEVRASSASSLLETELVCDVSHTPSATSASVPASGGLGPSVAVRAEKVGTRRLLVRWEETSCQVGSEAKPKAMELGFSQL